MSLSSCKELELGGKNLNQIFSDENIVSLIEAVKTGNTERADSMIEQGTDVNSVGEEGITPLLWLMAVKDSEAVKRILQLGANPNLKTINNDSPITLASGGKQLDILSLLIDFGGNLEIDGDEGMTPLLLSIRFKRWENMQLLVQKGANLNSYGGYRETPMQLAAGSGDYEQVNYLLESGADHNAENQNGSTLSHFLRYPTGDGSEWKAMVKKVLEEKGVHFPVPRPPRKPVFDGETEEQYQIDLNRYQSIIGCYLGKKQCDGFSFPTQPRKKGGHQSDEYLKNYELAVKEYNNEIDSYLASVQVN